MPTPSGSSAIDVAWVAAVVLTVVVGIAMLLPGVVGRAPRGEGLEWLHDQQGRRGAAAILLFTILSEIGGWAVTTYPRPPGDSLVVFNVAGAILAGTTFLIGMLGGFLFGIPRTLSGPDSDMRGDSISLHQRSSSGVATERRAYRVNTNLEQISDWLTKILVGVGLTQLGSLPQQLRSLGAYFAGSMGGVPETSERVAAASVVYFILCGFFIGYLWTRLYLSSVSRDAEAVAQAEEEISRVREAVSRLEEVTSSAEPGRRDPPRGERMQ